MTEQGIGARVKRREDKRFITGKGRYTDDIRVENQAYAAFVRSPHAYAKVTGINAAPALAMDGVIAVHTGPEMKADEVGDLIAGWAITSKDGSPMTCGVWNPMVTEYARYVGDHVAVVIAETDEIARIAAEAVEVTYEELTPAVSAVDALKEGAPQVHANVPGNLIFDWEVGDEALADAGLAKAAHVTEFEIVNNRLAPNAIEPRAAVAVYDEAEDHYTLYTTSQNPHVARLVLSAFYNVAPEHKLRVIAPDVGGGFGSKIYIYSEEIVCLWASMKTGRSVRWTAMRTESFMTDAHARDHVTKARMGFDADGRITGFKIDTVANIGAYASLFSTATPTYLYGTLMSGVYDIPGVYCNVKAVHTNTVPVGCLSRGRAARGHHAHRTDDRNQRPSIGHGSGRASAAELHQGVPVSDAGHPAIRLGRSAHLSRTRHRPLPMSPASRRGRQKQPPVASSAASATRPSSRPAASHLPPPSARSVPVSGFGKVPRSG